MEYRITDTFFDSLLRLTEQHHNVVKSMASSVCRSRAAEVLGVRRAALSDPVNGKAALSPEMALRIEKAFGVSMDTLLRMQAWHDSHMMRQRAAEIDVKRYEPA